MMLLRLVQIFLLTLPFQPAVSPSPGVDLSTVRVFALAIFGYWLFDGFLRKKLSVPFSITALLLASFVFVSAISFLWAENPGWALRRAVFFLSFFPLFLVFSSIVREFGEKTVSALLKAFVFGAGGAAIFGIIQSFSQVVSGPGTAFRFWIEHVMPLFLGEAFARSVAQYPSLLADIGGTTVLRATATFPDPHMFAFYLGLALPVALGLAILSESKKEKATLFSLFVLILSADLLSFSRGAYVGLGLGALIALMMILRRMDGRRAMIFVCVVSVTMIFGVFSDTPVKQRLFSSFSLEDGSNQGRLAIWKEAAGDIAEHPLLGHGIGNYPLAVKPTAEYREPIYAHNLFLDIATETGIVGALLFFTVFFTVFWNFLKEGSILFSASAVSFAIFFGHSLFDLPLYSVHLLPVLLLFFSIPGKRNEQKKW